MRAYELACTNVSAGNLSSRIKFIMCFGPKMDGLANMRSNRLCAINIIVAASIHPSTHPFIHSFIRIQCVYSMNSQNNWHSLEAACNWLPFRRQNGKETVARWMKGNKSNCIKLIWSDRIQRERYDFIYNNIFSTIFVPLCWWPNVLSSVIRSNRKWFPYYCVRMPVCVCCARSKNSCHTTQAINAR